MPFYQYRDYEQIDGHTSQDIYNEETREFLCHIKAFRKSKFKLLVYNFICIIVLGIPFLFLKSYPKVQSWFKYTECSLAEADIVLGIPIMLCLLGNLKWCDFLVRDSHNNYRLEPVLLLNVDVSDLGVVGQVKYFCHQYTKFIWVANGEFFCALDQLTWNQKTCEDFAKSTEGLSEKNYTELYTLFGPNKIEVDVKSYWRLFIEEIFNPFYLFQAFSIILWCVDDYFIYAGCVVTLTLFSSTTSLIQTRKQSQNLHDIVESSKCHQVAVLREIFGAQKCLNVEPEELVPGDLIILPAADYVMPCDAILLTGQCIVNESVLTGESVPVTKTEIPSDCEVYKINLHKRHTLFSGTHILQTRYYGGGNVLARVVKTGFDTTKGHLVKSILYPTPVNLQFYVDAFRFVYVLFTIAINGMFYCLYLYIQRHASAKEIAVRTLDIITIVVPPALPAAMAVGTVYSQNRLKKQKIFCISPPRINVCGKIKLACFDKTGTLTHDGLDMYSVIPCANGDFGDSAVDVTQLDSYPLLVRGMATCHSLTRVGGELTGDPLDLNMFDFTKWNLEEPGTNENTRFDMLAPTIVSPDRVSAMNKLKLSHNDLEQSFEEYSYKVGIIKEFSFSSSVQCMSVICKDLENPAMFIYTKGAPEKLLGLCNPSTVPRNFEERLKTFTANGYRVIALAYKDLPVTLKWKEAQKIKRDMIECELNLLGLLIMQNPLKIETTPVIRDLHQANIRTVMITGDNIMTAIAVARDCEMVGRDDDIYIISVVEIQDGIPAITLEKPGTGRCNEHVTIDLDSLCSYFAVDGKTWTKLKYHYPNLLPGLLVRTKIFARFQPDQKTQVVTALQELDYVVAMVGDGANDCGALKAAHVGVSLSTAEASVAAPFTSGIPNVSCLNRLISEGRCSLVTSFALFKYMALYSLIQFFSVLILYHCHSILGDFQFLYIDLLITTVLAVTMGRQGPCRELSSKRPMSSLVSSKNLTPLLLQVFSCAFVQLGALYFLYSQKWFEPIPPDSDGEIIVSWENTVLFTISCHQYVVLAWHFSKGAPYRQSVFTNYWFLISVIGLTTFTTWMMVAPCKKVAEIMELLYIPDKAVDQHHFLYILLLFPLAHFVLAGFIEKFIGDQPWVKKLAQCVRCKRMPKNKYKRLLHDQNFMNFVESLHSANSSPVID